MDTTRASLLVRVKNRDDFEAWRVFVDLYKPMLVRFARVWGLNQSDAEDVAQDCLASITKHIASFDYDPKRGGFKKWLRTIVNNRVRELRRKRRDCTADTGDFERPQQRERDPQEVFEQVWLQEHLRYCLTRIRSDVEPKTYDAFQHAAIDEWPVERICKVLSMTANQVYYARSRVTRRLRETMRDLLEGTE